jgi:hypothetical protein
VDFADHRGRRPFCRCQPYGLDAIKVLRENVNNGSLDGENGKILEHSLLAEMENLIRNGAAPKDIEKIDGIGRQQVLIEHRDVKLLEQSQADKN